MTLRQVNLRLDSETWDYLGKISELLGQTRSQMMREMIQETEQTLRKAFGDNPVPNKIDLANYYRTMLLETSRALAQVAEGKDTKTK
jgi:hypothetical protein